MACLYYQNDNVLQLTGVQNSSAQTYINDATVTATLVDKDGINLTGQTWPTTLVYVSDSDGVYRGTLEYDLGVSLYDRITAQITIDGGSGLRGYFEMPVTVLLRTP